MPPHDEQTGPPPEPPFGDPDTSVPHAEPPLDSDPADPAMGRFASSLTRAVQEVLARGLADPRVRGIITVTGVDIAPDRRDATIRVSIMPEDHEKLTMHGLRAATGHIRRQAMSRVRSRTFPRLAFTLDTGLKNQARVIEALGRAAAERPPAQASPRTQSPRPEGTDTP